MNVNLYLPDDLGRQAKDADLPLSQLLQAAVVVELERRTAVSTTLGGAQEHILEIEDNEGRLYKGRLVGTEIAYYEEVSVFLTEDDRILVHDIRNRKVHEIDDPEADLRDWLDDDDAYVEAMDALGITPIIDL